MEDTERMQIGNEKNHGLRIGLVIAAGIISTLQAYIVCPASFIIPLIPHMFEYVSGIPADVDTDILLYMMKWGTNGFATLPCSFVSQIYSTAFLLEIIFLVLGSIKKEPKFKSKINKAIMITMLVKIILAYLLTALEFVTGMLFLIFPVINNLVSYQHWAILCSIEALLMFLGAAVLTIVFFVYKHLAK